MSLVNLNHEIVNFGEIELIFLLYLLSVYNIVVNNQLAQCFECVQRKNCSCLNIFNHYTCAVTLNLFIDIQFRTDSEGKMGEF